MIDCRLPRWKIVVLVGLAAGIVAAFGVMTTLDHFTRQAPTYLRYFGIAFALYVGAAALLWQENIIADRRLLAGVFAAALLMRAPLWFTDPTLSTDIWRYLWDGRLLTQGVNPYAERVDSAVLDPLATDLRSRVQHQQMASPYPPVAQVAFSGIYGLVPESPTAMQVAFTLFDLAAGGVILLLLRRLKRPGGRMVLALWNPLLVVEFAHSAHVDSLMTLLVLLAIWFTLDERPTASMVALAAATLTKFLPALLLPVFVSRWGWKRMLGYGVLVAVGFAPFLGAGLGLSVVPEGTGLFGAVRIYGLSWRTNDGLFYWLVKGLEDTGLGQPINVARVASALVLAGVALGVWWQGRTSASNSGDRAADSMVAQESVVTGSVVLISAYLLLTAVMFPWYTVWLIALLGLLPVDEHPAWWTVIGGWVYFSAVVNLSYLFYLNPADPREIDWVRRVEYWPLFASLLAGMGWAMWRKQGRAALPADR